MTVPHAPHPWDEIGQPPPMAESYEAAERKAEVAEAKKRVEVLLTQAEEADERAQDLEEEADEERTAAENWRDEAEEIIEADIESVDPDTAAALSKRLGRS